jgi:type IV pilus assembly protein PilQ
MSALQKETDDARKMADAQKLAEALKVRVIPVSYANPTNLSTQLKDFLSERGKVVADIRTSSVVVTDVEENLVRIANLVKALDIPPLQVQIEGKVVEAGDRFNRDFGITWGSRGQDVALGGNLSLAQNISVSAPSEGGKAGELSLRLGTLDILGDLTAALSLYEKNSLVRIVSSPRIVTMNNEAASIVQSTNIPIPQIQQTNNGPTTSYTYRPIELRLEVTPQITADNDVIMALTIKREFAASIDKTPDINSREAKTKVLVHNGQTAVIGGIYQSDQTDQAAGVPWLKDVPVLGWLFKSTSKSSTKNELLLFLTPRILNAEQGTPKEGTL